MQKETAQNPPALNELDQISKGGGVIAKDGRDYGRIFLVRALQHNLAEVIVQSVIRIPL